MTKYERNLILGALDEMYETRIEFIRDDYDDRESLGQHAIDVAGLHIVRQLLDAVFPAELVEEEPTEKQMLAAIDRLDHDSQNSRDLREDDEAEAYGRVGEFLGSLLK